MSRAWEWLRSLRGRFAIVMAVVALLVGLRLVSVVGLEHRLEQSQARAHRAQAVQLEEQVLLTAMLDQETGLRAYIDTADASHLRRYLDGRQAAAAGLAQLAAEESGTGARLLADVRLRAAGWETWAEETRAAVAAGGPPAAGLAERSTGDALFDAFRTAQRSLVAETQLEQRAVERQQAADSAQLGAGQYFSTGLLLAALVLLSAIFFRSTLRPLARLVTAASLLAAGEEVTLPSSRRGDEVGRLTRALAAWQRLAADRLHLAQQALHARERWERMFNVSRDLHALAGTDGYFKQLNPAWRDLLGYSDAELMARPYIEFVHPADRESTLREAGKLAGGSETVRFENRYRSRDGRFVWLEWTATPDASEGVVYAIARDVSWRKRQERSVSDLNRAALAMSGVADPAVLGGIVVKSAAQLLSADTATMSWFDPETRELVTLADSEGAEGVPRRRRLGEGALGLAAQGRKPVVVPDYPAWPGALDLGGRMPASVLAVPLMSGRQSIGGLAVASRTKREFDEQDVQLLFLLAAQAAPALEQAALFERLQAANEELRRASEVKDSFLASMSHELRTPLNAILGFSELLIDYPDESPEVRQEYLRTIYSSGQHLLNLINDLLDVAKIEAGKMDVQPESITLSPLVSDVVTSLASLSAAKGIAVRVDVPSRLRVWADLRHVRQILINLLSNAFKFTASGGAVSVTAAEQGAVVAIRVVDTGIGIAAEHLAGIFDQFTQVRQAGVVTQGTGLGLALTKRLCELNGGLIDVRSEVGRGSVFTVRLPVAADAGEEPEPGGPADGPGKLVLVVEDDPASAELLERQLRRGGYEVAVANRGADALELAATRRPLAVTLDLMLPDLDGWDVLRSLKANVRTRDLPVIVVSVLDDHRRAQALGAVDFLQKPIDAPLLLASLARFAPPAGDGPRRVLAIDDDPAVLEVVRRALSRAGFEVMTARGGAEGLEIARSERPGLIVVDLLMPEVDGFEVIARLRADAATKDAAILVLTSREVTPEEKVRLNGKVAAILRKGEPAGADLLAWVRRIDAARDGDS